MADKQSRLAEIYKAEKSKGGGIASTLGKRALEKMDPRKFFNQKGFLAASLPSLFKSYSATPTKTGEKLASAGGGSFSSGVLETKMDILTGETRELKIHSKLAAKNSVVLPSMARDMNVTRQNIVKLVKLQGGNATTKADMFFKRAGDREASYESRFSKAGGLATKTPTQVGAKPEEKESGGILGFLGTIASYLLKGGLLGLLAIGVGKLLENQDVLEGIKSFVKQVILGIQKIIQKGSEILGDLFSDPEVKEGFIKTFVAVKDLFVKGINLLGDLASDPRFAAGVVEIFSAIFTAIKKAFVTLDTYLKDELNVPGGLLTVLGIGGALYLAIIALGGALAGLAAAAGKLVLPGAPPRAPVPGAPPGAPVPGAPPGAPGKGPIIKPGTIGEKVPTGFNKTAEDKIRERATRMAAEQGAKDVAKKGAGEVLKRFFAGAVIGGPIAAIWATAYTAYQVIDYLAPDEQQEVIDSVAVLASIQDDINQGGNEKELRKRASLYEAKLKRLGIVPQQIESAKVQALPSAPNESGAEAARLAGSGNKPTPAPYSPSADSQAANTTTPSSIPNIPGSSKETLKTPTIEKFDYTKYKELVGIREGGGKYDADNKVGFLGKYQFGAQALETFKYLKPGTSADRNAVYSPSNWTGKNNINSADDFKKASDVQENLMNAYTDMNLKGLQKSGVLTGEDSGSSIAAKLYAAHHGGVGGASKFFKENKDTADFAFAGASVGKSAALMAKAYDTGQIGGAEYSGLGGTQVASAKSSQTPETASAAQKAPAAAPNLKMPTMGTLTAAAPSMGDMIESATSTFTDALRMFDSALSSITNITNNNTQASAAGQQSQGNLPSVYDDVFLNLFQRVT